MNAQPVTTERYHAFDALRAAMMLLGVVLHSATAYSTFPDVWWLKDPQTSRGADVLLLFIHAFRLPAFFVMSGFFAALLMGRRGAGIPGEPGGSTGAAVRADDAGGVSISEDQQRVRVFCRAAAGCVGGDDGVAGGRAAGAID